MDPNVNFVVAGILYKAGADRMLDWVPGYDLTHSQRAPKSPVIAALHPFFLHATCPMLIDSVEKGCSLLKYDSIRHGKCLKWVEEQDKSMCFGRAGE